MSYPDEDVALLAMGGVVAVCHLLLFLRFEVVLLWEFLKTNFLSLRGRIRRCFGAQSSADPVNHAVAKEVCHLQRAKAKVSVALARNAIGVLVLVIISNIMTGKPRWFTFGQVTTGFVLCLVFCVAGVVQSRCSDRMMDVLHILLMASDLIFCWFVKRDVLHFVATSNFLFVVRFFIAWSCERPVLVTLFNIVHFTLSTLIWQSISEAMRHDMDQHFFGSVAAASTMPPMAAGEYSTICALAGISWGMMKATWSEAEKIVEVKTLHDQGAALNELLDLACDAAVELDEELRFTDAATRVAALLTLDYNRSLKGCQFTQFMPESSDRRLFESRLLASAGSSDGFCPGALHVTLRDSLSCQLRVEMFYIRFLALSGQSRYLVGLREFADNVPAPIAVPDSVKEGVSSSFESSHRSKDKQSGRPGSQRAKNRHAGSSSTGTAAVAVGKSSDRTPPRSPRVLGRARLALPNCIQTSIDSRQKVLIDAMTKVNVTVDSGACCVFHSAAKSMSKLNNKLITWKCAPDFCLANAQCRRCGLLENYDDDEEDEERPCFGCGSKDIRPVRSTLEL
eukprot:TRINITY_DN28417_c0_g1_i2.p1 TRINITY_DN28417_c0_g1~~TRINITY_DN28417_c0_g1_i2.p1  ORF type:complete len:566 (-),score=103.83 TRINITY_DN28417_c0_g1_i2:174-1871(-)